MAGFRCPTCGADFEAPSLTVRHLPFCSERCQRIDLGRWLRESYSFPVTRDDDEEEESDELAHDAARHDSSRRDF